MEGMKQYKFEIAITSILTLCPIILGLLLWSQMPDMVATHFNIHNEPDGWSSKEFAVFGIPLFLFVAHWICIAATFCDPKNKNISRKLIIVILWIMPVVSMVTNGSVLLQAAGKTVDIGVVVNLLCGVMFLVIGNYLPKCKQNYTVGIKTSWALDNEENWNKTHRCAGWCYMIVGICFFINSILTFEVVIVIAIAICALLPCVYSFLLYKKGK